MADPEHLDVFLAGRRAWHEWRRNYPHVSPDLSGVDISDHVPHAGSEQGMFKDYNLGGCNLNSFKIRYRDLSECIFVGSNLHLADLSNCELIKTDFSRCNLKSTALFNSDLSGSLFQESHLSRIYIYGALFDNAEIFDSTIIGCNFDKSRLLDASIRGNTFVSVGLSGAIDLPLTSGVSHNIIDLPTASTLNDDQHSFLRSSGMREWEIELSKIYRDNISPLEISDVMNDVFDKRSSEPIYICNLFISYSHRDAEFVDHLEGLLQSRKIRYWRDIHDAPAGPLEQVVLRAMTDNPTVLLILSEHSVDSDWVEYEAQEARKIEKNMDRYVLCPIALDDSWKHSKWSSVLRNQIEKYNILDFSNWRDDATLKRQLDRLISGLSDYYTESDG